jgi:hypothetical protein
LVERTGHTPNVKKEKCEMKTIRNNANDGENTGELPVFVTFDGVAYILCQYCGNPMDANSNVYCWQEDKVGKPYNLHLVHYNCQRLLEETHEGKWFSKGMPSPKIIWDADDEDIVEAESWLRRPRRNLKRIFLVWNKHIAVVGVFKSISIALQLKPVGGSVVAVTPRWLVRQYVHHPVVRRFLETYDGGRWLQPMVHGK